mmetsp:Transcript_15485/g.31331  ORF Transcript_15485/g.31331 Transcript_15485/m.31331 type:complete len:1333 (-) Transcript_15485:789-4787(-)
MFPDRVVDAALRLDSVLAHDQGFGGAGVLWELASEYCVADSGRQDFILRRQVPLPQALMEQYTYLESKCFIGLLPEIHRAWFTIDTRLFLWNYADGLDLYPFEGADQIIVSVGLFKPRPGVFVEDVRYILLVSTPVEVLLLGVCFAADGALTLVPTEMSVPTDGVSMLNIAGTKEDGRIFLAARDGSLYEILYGETSLWSNLLRSGPLRRARLVNRSPSLGSTILPSSIRATFWSDDPLLDIVVDDQRSVLYTLAESGRVTLYCLGQKSCKRLDCADTATHAKRSSSTAVKSRAIIGIFTIPEEVSSVVHLVVVSSLGERLYYSTTKTGSVMEIAHAGPVLKNSPSHAMSRADIPRFLRLVGFRPSPPLTGVELSHPRVHRSLWSWGGMILSDARDAHFDTLVAIFPELRPGHSNSTSLFSAPRTGLGDAHFSLSCDLPSVRESVTEIPLSFRTDPQQVVERYHSRAWAIAECSRVSGSEPSTSTENPRDFIVLTNTAIHLYSRLRPIDMLRNILSVGGSDPDIRWFIQHYGYVECCAACLGIIASVDRPIQDRARPGEVDGTVIERAKQCFRTCSGEPELNLGDMGNFDPSPGTSLGGHQFIAGRPSTSQYLIRYSPGHEAISLCLARVLRCIWTSFLTTSRDPNGFQSFTMPSSMMRGLRRSLLSMGEFLNSLTDSSLRVSADISTETTSSFQEKLFVQLLKKRKADEARRLEAESIESMSLLCFRSAEALSLLCYLEDNRIHRLLGAVSIDLRKEFVEMRFGELVASERGEVAVGALIESLFASYDDAYIIESLGESLQSQCPSFFGGKDAIMHKGLSLLRQAVQLRERQETSSERILELAELSLATLEPVVSRIFDLPSVCGELRSIGAVPALVRLSLRYAEEKNTAEGNRVAFACIFEALRALILSSEGSSPIDDIAKIKGSALRLAFESTNLRFLDELYRFVYDLGPLGIDELFSHPSKRLEVFLEEKSTTNKDLMWKYYARQSRFVEAAMILTRLANDETCNFSLEERLNLLSTAMVNSKAGYSQGDVMARTQLREISDRLDVARVQLKIRDALNSSGDAEAVEAARELDGILLDLSTLYNSYARPWELWSCELESLRCAGYRDDSLIRRLWSRIVEREFQSLSQGRSFESVRDRLAGLGKEFYPSDLAFPIAWLVHLLESESLHKNSSRSANSPELPAGWVARVMHQVGVPAGDVVSAYHALLENQDLFDGDDSGTRSFSWGSEASQVHLIQSLEAWLQDLWKLSGSRIDGSALQALALCRSRLRGMSHPDASSILARLERLDPVHTPVSLVSTQTGATAVPTGNRMLLSGRSSATNTREKSRS